MTEDEISTIHAFNGALVKWTIEQCRYNCSDKKEVLRTMEALAVGMMKHNQVEADKALQQICEGMK